MTTEEFLAYIDRIQNADIPPAQVLVLQTTVSMVRFFEECQAEGVTPNTTWLEKLLAEKGIP